MRRADSGSGPMVDVARPYRASLSRLGNASWKLGVRINGKGLSGSGERVWRCLLLLPYPDVVRRRNESVHRSVTCGDGQSGGDSLRGYSSLNVREALVASEVEWRSYVRAVDVFPESWMTRSGCIEQGRVAQSRGAYGEDYEV